MIRFTSSGFQILWLLTFFSHSFFSLAQQNLVPNGNFETYTSCPANGSGTWWMWVHVPPWIRPLNQFGAPEYFNACASSLSSGVPNNVYGFQHALTDSGYIGIACYQLPDNPELREYIQVQLTEPLCAGQKYKAGFFTNKSNKARYAISNLSMRITVIPDTGDSTYAVIPVAAQIKNPDTNILSDTVNWMEISDIYTATGGEQFITIGNFDVDSNTNVVDSVGLLTFKTAYYYIDSVFVIPDSLPENLITNNDTSVCPGASIELSAASNENYLWQNANGDTLGTDSVLTLTPETSMQVFLKSCHARDSIFITITEPITVNLGNDTILCEGGSLLLYAGSGANAYSWNTGDTTSQIYIFSPQFYSVTVTNECGSAADTIFIQYDSIPVFSLGNDTTLCYGDIFYLFVPQNIDSWQWNNGSADSTFTVTQQGIYYLQVVSGVCTATDTIAVNSIGSDTLLCDTVSNYTLDAGQGFTSYQWSTGSANQTITVSDSGAYSVTVTDAIGCTATDSIQIAFSPCVSVSSFNIQNSSFIIYPNPNDGTFTVEMNIINEGNAIIRIFGIKGEVVYEKIIRNLQSNHKAPINISGFSAGTYLLQVETQKGVFQQKIQIK
jgi:hypothetical protein